MRKHTGSILAVAGLAALLAAAQEPSVLPEPSPTPEPPPTRTPKPRPTVAPSSLAETVRRTQDGKTAQEAPKKKSLGVITNESLKTGTPTAKTKGGTLNIAPATKSGPAPTAVDYEHRDRKGRGEAEWRQMAAAARGRIAKADAEVKRLELETKRLENDFYAWDDGSYRDRVIKPAWDQALGDLKKARAEADAARAAWSDLEDEARKNEAFPGWLRESGGSSKPSSGP